MSKQTKQSIRRAILKAMQAQDMSQSELARQTGMKQQAINRYCTAHCDMAGRNLDKLFRALRLKIKKEEKR